MGSNKLKRSLVEHRSWEPVQHRPNSWPELDHAQDLCSFFVSQSDAYEWIKQLRESGQFTLDDATHLHGPISPKEKNLGTDYVEFDIALRSMVLPPPKSGPTHVHWWREWNDPGLRNVCDRIDVLYRNLKRAYRFPSPDRQSHRQRLLALAHAIGYGGLEDRSSFGVRSLRLPPQDTPDSWGAGRWPAESIVLAGLNRSQYDLVVRAIRQIRYHWSPMTDHPEAKTKIDKQQTRSARLWSVMLGIHELNNLHSRFLAPFQENIRSLLNQDVDAQMEQLKKLKEGTQNWLHYSCRHAYSVEQCMNIPRDKEGWPRLPHVVAQDMEPIRLNQAVFLAISAITKEEVLLRQKTQFWQRVMPPVKESWSTFALRHLQPIIAAAEWSGKKGGAASALQGLFELRRLRQNLLRQKEEKRDEYAWLWNTPLPRWNPSKKTEL